MKKIYFSLLSVIAVFSMNTQLTQTNNAPAASDTYTMVRCDSVTTVPGASGANAVWNFSGITTFNSLVRNYGVMAVSTTTYPAANVALSSAVSDVSYLGSNPNALLYYGGNIGVGTISGSITYSAPAVHRAYPMSLNTNSTAIIGGSMSIPAFGATGTYTGTSTAIADGSGTINLPGGVTFSNTLRVLTTQTMYVATSIPFTSATVTLEDYNYFADGVKAPVFTISSATAVVAGALNQTTTQKYVARNSNPVATPPSTSTVGVPDLSSNNFSFMAFPNPSSTNLNVTTNHPGAKYVSVFDITGKLVEKQTINSGKVKLDVSDYNNGLYIYRIIGTDESVLKVGKVTVSH